MQEIEELFFSASDYLLNRESITIEKQFGENIYRIYFEFDYTASNEKMFETEYSDMKYSMRSRGWEIEEGYCEVRNKTVLKISI